MYTGDIDNRKGRIISTDTGTELHKKYQVTVEELSKILPKLASYYPIINVTISSGYIKIEGSINPLKD